MVLVDLTCGPTTNLTNKDLPRGLTLKECRIKGKSSISFEEAITKVGGILKEKFQIEIGFEEEGEIKAKFNSIIDNFSFVTHAKIVHEITLAKNPDVKELYLYIREGNESGPNPSYNKDNERENWEFNQKRPNIIFSLEKQFGVSVTVFKDFALLPDPSKIQVIFGYQGRNQGSSGDKRYEEACNYHTFRHLYPNQITYWPLWSELHGNDGDVKGIKRKIVYSKTLVDEARKHFIQ